MSHSIAINGLMYTVEALLERGLANVLHVWFKSMSSSVHIGQQFSHDENYTMDNAQRTSHFSNEFVTRILTKSTLTFYDNYRIQMAICAGQLRGET